MSAGSTGIRDEQRVLAALALERVGPEVALGEGVVDPGVVEDPALGLELGVELARAPSGVAGEDAHPGQVRDRIEVDHADRADQQLRRVAGSSCSAIAVTALGCTGPPMWSSSSPVASSKTPGTASATVDSDGRFRTSPNAPSSLWSTTSTTALWKKSPRAGEAIRSCPLSESGMSVRHSPRYAVRLACRRCERRYMG